MKISFKKTYTFALKSSLYISLFAGGFVLLLIALFFEPNERSLILFISLFFLIIYVFSFLVIQYRVERFIYRRVKKIYDEVSLLESSSFIKQSITTDMETLSQEVKKFARDKKLEIELLKAREDYRREFLGNVSHELKTPLFTVQGYLSTLLDSGMTDKKLRKKYLERAEKGVERLISIVEDLDMISKLETGDLHLEVTGFDIVKVVQDVFDLLEMKAAEKDIILLFDRRYSKPIMVEGDEEKIEQVIINLVMNSIKYGKAKGSTEVSIDEFIGKKVIVRVKDNGLGIEKQFIPRLFERFFRVDKTGSRAVGGSGLGLSIVKHIIEAHNEKIYVKSEYEVGSEFSFTLTRSSI